MHNKNIVKALLNTVRRPILGVRSHRIMTCEELAQLIALGNPADLGSL